MREEQLSVRRKKRKRVAAAAREAMPLPEQPNVRWSMDFVADTLGDGRTFRVLNIVDDFSREALETEVGKSIPETRVVRVLERLAQLRGLPSTIVVDSGPGFTSRVLDQWAYQHGVELHASRGTRLALLCYRSVRCRVIGRSTTGLSGAPRKICWRAPVDPGGGVAAARRVRCPLCRALDPFVDARSNGPG